MKSKVLTIHQPEFMPWLGFIDKASMADTIVLLDNVQYRHKYFQNRNKIKGNNGEMWLNVPIIRKGKTRDIGLIKDIKINNNENWRKKIIRSIEFNYKKSNNFEKYFPLIEDIFNKEWELLSELNIYIIQKIFNKLNINTKIIRASELNIEGTGEKLILDICKDGKLVKEKGIKKAINSGKLSKGYSGEILNKHRFIYEGFRPSNLDDIPYAAIDLLESDPYGYNVLEDYINTPVWGIAANNSSATPFTMKRSLTSVSSRGCPYACAFCYRGAQGERNYGMRSSEHIALQIRGYVDKYDLDFIGFPDDNFAVDKRRIKKMVPVFKEYGLDHVRWGTHTRMDEADARAYDMAESGCVYIGFGAESADEHTLTKMQKGGFILKNGLVPTKVNGNT